MQPIFQHRIDAGRRLARELAARGYTTGELLVLGIPRGGMLVASLLSSDAGRAWLLLDAAHGDLV